MKALIFGSRTFSDEVMVKATITGLWHTRPGTEGFTVITGGAQGADTIAAEVARRLEWAQVRTYPAEWDVHAPGWCPGERCVNNRSKYGIWHDRRGHCMVAGPRRNQQMIDEEHREDEPIDLAVGFVDKPLRSSRGSNDMRNRLVTAEIPVSVLWSPNLRPIDSFVPPAWDRGNYRGFGAVKRPDMG